MTNNETNLAVTKIILKNFIYIYIITYQMQFYLLKVRNKE